MNTKSRILILVVSVALFTGCRCSSDVSEELKAEQFEALPFPDAIPPAMIESAADKAEYMALHFWDAFTDPSERHLCDSIHVNGVSAEIVEQKFADWAYMLDMVDIKVASDAVGRLYDRALAYERKDTLSNIFETFIELTDKYLYNPNSPLRNEDYYLPFVSRLSVFEGLDEHQRKKYERQTRLCSLNRIGTKAADFRFSDKSGRMRRLYDIKAPLTLLFFSNPGCDACMNIIQVLKDEPMISSMISEGKLAVLNIYIDEDIQEWYSYMPVYPEQWYNGFDPDLVIRTDVLYDVRAIPSLYLLDADKDVVMKDAPENKVFEYLLRYRI
ncbi:MAG: DUF5106 domain-containing protein [Bacteroidales bacterium]|nr:DUF5106 domain-containing protein [Bacteroidales bacterium]